MDLKPLIERAIGQATALAKEAGVAALAPVAEHPAVGTDMLRSLLAHELVASHNVMMRLAGKAEHFLGLIAPDRSAEEQDRGCRQAVQLSGAASRLTERYRLGVMSLARLERPTRAARTRLGRMDDEADGFEDDDEDPFDGGPGGGRRRKSPARQLTDLAALNKAMAAMLDKVQPNGAAPNGGSPAPQQPAATPNRGRLRHGNPSGDFLAAPRCGATTRCGDACRQPAMANGRCRLHGGKSTGARTAEGLARCRTASLVHGHRTAEIIALKSAAARHGRNLRALAQATRRATNLQSERPTPCPASGGGQTTDDRRQSVPATALRAADATGISGQPALCRLSSVVRPLKSERPTPCPASGGQTTDDRRQSVPATALRAAGTPGTSGQPALCRLSSVVRPLRAGRIAGCC
jgi:hypothetical protein